MAPVVLRQWPRRGVDTDLSCFECRIIFGVSNLDGRSFADYKNGQHDLKSKLFNRLTALACVVGLSVPILGANPIVAQIATQVANVFILPLVIGGIIYFINQKVVMEDMKAGWLLNSGLGLAFIFSCVMSYIGIVALLDFF